MLYCCCSLLTFLEKQEWIENIILDSSQMSNSTETFLGATDLQLNTPQTSARELRNDPGKGLYMHMQRKVYTHPIWPQKNNTHSTLWVANDLWRIYSPCFFSKKIRLMRRILFTEANHFLPPSSLPIWPSLLLFRTLWLVLKGM